MTNESEPTARRHTAKVSGHSFLYTIRCWCGFNVGGAGNREQAEWIRDKHNSTNGEWAPMPASLR